MPILLSRRLVREFEPLLQSSHAIGTYTQKLTHFEGCRQKAKILLIVNSWVENKKVLKAGLRVQGTPIHTTALLTSKGSSTAFLWRRWISNALVSQVLIILQVPVFSHSRKHERIWTLLYSCFLEMLIVFPSTWEMPKPGKQNPGSPELPRYGPDRAGAAKNPSRVLREIEWLSEMPAHLLSAPSVQSP